MNEQETDEPESDTSTEEAATPIIESLLKRPADLIRDLQEAPGLSKAAALLGCAAIALGLYGILVGSFAGGSNWYTAPAKITMGALLTMLICIPSLFIFACLSGAEVTLRGVAGVLCAAMALAGLLLVGFAPVAWVFSQSTNSIAFIGSLHILFWLISLHLGLRLIAFTAKHTRAAGSGYLRIWCAIFVLVSLQMTTALRPILGTSPNWFTPEKKFFLAHWVESIGRDIAK